MAMSQSVFIIFTIRFKCNAFFSMCNMIITLTANKSITLTFLCRRPAIPSILGILRQVRYVVDSLSIMQRHGTTGRLPQRRDLMALRVIFDLLILKHSLRVPQ